MSTTGRGVLRLILLGLCLAGAWICAELVKEQAGAWPTSGQASALSSGLCSPGHNGGPGCTEVLDSKWSAVDIRVPVPTRNFTIRSSRVVLPVAFVGLAYFVFLGTWYAFAGPPFSWGYRWYLIPLIAVLAGAGGSVALLWVLLVQLKARCTWCLVTHGINGLIVVGTLCLWPRRRSPGGASAAAQSPEGVAGYAHPRLKTATALRVVGFALLLIAGLWVYRGAKLDIRDEVARLLPYKKFVEARAQDPAFLLREYYAEPLFAIPARSSEGAPDTGVGQSRLVIFTDLQCPHSACFTRRWKREFRDHYSGPLRVELRHFPLCPDCNDTVGQQLHPQACAAAYAVEAARLQGGDDAFWQMHDLLLRYQPRLQDGLYAELATEIGLDGDQLITDMQSDAVRQVVATDVALAAELGVTGTPAVFLNGRPVSELCLYNPTFWEAASAELRSEEVIVAGDEATSGDDESLIARR